MSQRLQRRVVCSLLACLALSHAFAQERRPVDTPAQSRVFGRVVDTDGKPLAGVAARLRSVDGPWAGGIVVPLIRMRSYEMPGFEVASQADGRFELHAPMPTADWISLDLEPDRYHDIDGREFGPAGGRDQPRLVAGDNDLGEFRLAAAGAIAGRVLDERGQPVAGAEARLDNSFPGARGRGGRSDATGAFAIEHVPAGTYGVEVLRDGFKRATRPAIAVRANETSNAGDVVLEIAPTISGVVVDERGQPVANAWVWGWPDKSGIGAGARSDAQGRFVVALKQVEPHRFDVEADGYAKLEELHAFFGSGTGHPVGATDVRLVMKRPVLTTFVVLDAATSQPVTKYRLELAWRPTDTSNRSGGEPEHRGNEHPNGEFTCEADPALFDYTIRAKGYSATKGQVTHESPNSPRCVVRLAREAAIRGRVLLDGKPVERAEIQLYPASLLRYHEEDSSGPFDENDYYWNWEGQTDLVFTLPSATQHWTDKDGSFALAGLPSGEYRLEISGPKGSRKSLDPVGVGVGGSSELGDIALAPGATLVGEVIIPVGIDPTTIELTCYVLGKTSRAAVAADRSFRFTEVVAGKGHLGVSRAAGLVTWGTSPEVVLAPGQTQRTTFDLTDRAASRAALVVLVNGKPAEGVRVWLKASAGGLGDHMNYTDVLGRTAREVRAMGPTDVVLKSQSLLPLGTFEKRLDLVAGQTSEATIEVSCATLELEWPRLAPHEQLSRVLVGADMDDDAKRQFVHAMPQFDASQNDARITGDNKARFNWITPGKREWTISIETVEKNQVQRNHTFRRVLDLVAGESTELVLTEHDRVQAK